jgi:fermentation-respiration switch protein FrsA (DUF1100 family)
MNNPLKRMIGIIVLVVGVVLIVALLVRQFEARFAFFPFAGENRTPEAFGVAFTPLTIVTADGERLRAWHLPRADAVAPVIYFHGNGGNLSVWSDVLVGIVQRGYEVVAVDYRGFGLSTGTPSEQGLYRDVDATLTFVNSGLRRRDVPVIYWGRSIGTVMASYAASRQTPDGVILEAGFPDARSIFAGNPVMLALTMFASYRFPAAQWMSSVTAPALVIHGDHDSVIAHSLGRKLYESLPGPKRFVTIPGGDHNDPEPPDAELYWGAVQDFVTSIPARP